MVQKRIFAVGLLSRQEVEALGSSFHRLWTVEDTPCFSSLLQALDRADRYRDKAEGEITCGSYRERA